MKNYVNQREYTVRQNFPVTVFHLGAACGRSIPGICTFFKKKLFIYSLFQSQQSSVEGKWKVKVTRMHNDHKLPGRHQLFCFFWGRQKTTLYFYQDRYNSCLSVLLEILLKISIGRRRKDGLSPKARRTWKNLHKKECTVQGKSASWPPTSLSLIWLQRNRKTVVFENSKEFRCLHQFCPPSTISDFLARTASLEMSSQGGYANLRGQVTYVPCLWVWHTPAASPPSNLSSSPSSTDLLLEHPHTCDHFGCGLDTSVEYIHCTNPPCVQAHPSPLCIYVWHITQWIRKSRIKTFRYMEKGLENKSSTWIVSYI